MATSASSSTARPPPPPFPTSTLPPNQTLYISNLNDRINKDDLRLALYTLFTTYGVVLDVVALKTMKMRGQAHITFRDITTATAAMRACQGMKFFDKEMKISYAKNKSNTIAKLDGTFRSDKEKAEEASKAAPSSFAAIPGQEKKQEEAPAAAAAAAATATTAAPTTSAAEDSGDKQGTKRRRDESEPEEEDDDVEMEVEDDD